MISLLQPGEARIATTGRSRSGSAKTALFLVFILLLLPEVSAAQAPELPPSAGVLDQLVAMRGLLERIEKGQRVLLAILTIQIDENRVSALEAQKQQLSRQEQDLSKQVRQASEEFLTLEIGGPALLSAAGAQDPATQTATKARQDQAARKVEEVRRTMETLDQSIVDLRLQISAMEKQLAEALK